MPRFRRNLWLLLGQNLTVFLGIAVQGLVLNLYLVGLGFREDFVGLVAFTQTAAIGAGAFPASALAPRVGIRRCLIGATFILGAAVAGVALLEQAPLLLAAVAISGLAMAHVFVPSAPFLMDNTSPTERHAAFAANFAALSVASIAGSALGGILPGLIAGTAGSVVGYRAALLVGAALTAAGASILLLADDSRVPVSAVPTAPSTGRVSQPSIRRDLIAMTAAVALLAAATGLVVAFFNVYLRDVVLVPTEAIGTIFAIGALAMAPASLIGPAAARRWGPVGVIATTRILTIPALLALALLPPGFVVSALVYAARAGLVSVSQPLDNAFAMELVSPRLRTRISALRTLAWNGGWAIATGLGGLAIVGVGYPAIFITAAALTALSVVIQWRAFRGR